MIDECPGVNLHTFDKELLENHKEVMRELINRDKNRPSVIAWSIANEPKSFEASAENYFHEIAEFTKSIDPQKRPITAALNADFKVDHAAPSLDIVGLNRYKNLDISYMISKNHTNFRATSVQAASV